MAIQDEGKGEGGYTSLVGYSMYPSGLKKDYGWNRCVFNEERNKVTVGQDSSGRGRERKRASEYQGLCEGICQRILDFC